MNRPSFARIDSELKRFVESQLELGLDQPSCGCRVEWEWRWCNQGIPDAVHVLEIKACDKHRIKEQAELICDLYQGFLNERLGRSRRQ